MMEQINFQMGFELWEMNDVMKQDNWDKVKSSEIKTKQMLLPVFPNLGDQNPWQVGQSFPAK